MRAVGEEVASGMIGGALSCWNQPFEVARIEMQASADQAATAARRNMVQVLRSIYGEYGMAGMFKGVLPRMGLGMYQTLFMVTGAKMVKEWMAEDQVEEM